MRQLLMIGMIAFVSVASACFRNKEIYPRNETPIPTRTLTPVPANNEEAILQIIAAESEAREQQDIDRLKEIWAPDGIVTDAKHTATNIGDDLVWPRWLPIRDYYTNYVFSSQPPFKRYVNIRLTIEVGMATAITDTKIGSTNFKDNDHWTFEKINGRWQITSLTLDLSPQK